MNECPKCGSPNPENAKFCGRCGTRLTSVAAPDANPSPEPSDGGGNAMKWVYIIGGAVIAILLVILLVVNLRGGGKETPTQDTIASIPEIASVSDSGAGEPDVSAVETPASAPKEVPKEAPKPASSSSMGFHDGVNKMMGYMIHSDTEKWPFTVQFNYNASSDRISNVVYVNLTSKTKVNMSVSSYDGYTLDLTGHDGRKSFRLLFSGSNPYYGDSWWGDHHESMELSLQ